MVRRDVDLERFVEAHERQFDDALAEIRSGRKRTHWMWFVFPQLRGLGASAMSWRYGIGSWDEAAAYLVHPLLGPRLNECTEAVNRHRGRSAEAIFGPVDALKLRSSMTLFELVGGGPQFRRCLEAYFGGEPDRRTIELLDAQR